MQDLPPRPSDQPPRWKPVSATDRRVLGVLVEKAKTTPDAYPMSVNAIVTAANQKSNRFPTMSLEPEDVEESLERLRELGAVAEVQSGGRVPRFRHYLYEWLGVDKIELAVMAELLLRGAQTEGELRGRASRMETIADLGALRAILTSLKAKGLVVSLTPEGRGHVVTHALYEPRELEKLKTEYSTPGTVHGLPAPGEERAAAGPGWDRAAIAGKNPAVTPSAEHANADVAELRTEVAELRAELQRLRQEFEEFRATFTASQPTGQSAP